MQFTDPGAERAIIGCITAGTFFDIPQNALIPPEAFHEPIYRIVYSAAAELTAKGQPAYIASVNSWLQNSGGWRQLEKELHPSSWETWSNGPDESYAFMPPGIIEDCLKRIHRCYTDREAARIGSELNSGVLTLPTACEALASLLHGSNGKVDLKSLDERLLDLANPPDQPVSILTLGGQNIATPGNLTTILAQAKAGKSAIVGAIVGALIADNDGDFLGWHAVLNLENHAVIHFDTEQSPFDHYRVVSRAMHRAQRGDLPPWLYTYRLADVPTVERRDSLEHEMARRSKQHGGILCVLLDGVGDLALDTNSIEESNKLVAYLHQLAIKYKCVIICVLHENPGKANDNPKARGHLGSELERKSESNIRLVKDEDDITTQSTGKSRHATISEHIGPRFAFDATLGMHVSVTEPKGPRPSHNDIEFVDELFRGPEAVGGFTWKAIIARIKELAEVSAGGAEKRLHKYMALKLITKVGEHYKQA